MTPRLIAPSELREVMDAPLSDWPAKMDEVAERAGWSKPTTMPCSGEFMKLWRRAMDLKELDS